MFAARATHGSATVPSTEANPASASVHLKADDDTIVVAGTAVAAAGQGHAGAAPSTSEVALPGDVEGPGRGDAAAASGSAAAPAASTRARKRARGADAEIVAAAAVVLGSGEGSGQDPHGRPQRRARQAAAAAPAPAIATSGQATSASAPAAVADNTRRSRAGRAGGSGRSEARAKGRQPPGAPVPETSLGADAAGAGVTCADAPPADTGTGVAVDTATRVAVVVHVPGAATAAAAKGVSAVQALEAAGATEAADRGVSSAAPEDAPGSKPRRGRRGATGPLEDASEGPPPDGPRRQRRRAGAVASATEVKATAPAGQDAAAQPATAAAAGKDSDLQGGKEEALGGKQRRPRGTRARAAADKRTQGATAPAEPQVAVLLKEEPGAVPAASPAARRKGKKAADPRFIVLSAEEAQAVQSQPLLDLGELVVGKLIRRPSASIKTPYVADVELVEAQSPLPADPESAPASAAVKETSTGCGAGGPGALVLAHAPAMDCAGMVAPGALLYMSTSAARKEGAPRTATSHAIQLVEDKRPGGSVAVVGSHPQLAERLAAELLRRRCLAAALGPYDGVDAQRTFGNTRVDYVLRMADGSWTLLEVKNVVCADFPEGGVPAGRPAVGVYTTRVAPGAAYQPTALFPHGAAKPKIKVVSDRAIKHVYELTQLHSAGIDEATGTRVRCAVLFVVNRSDCAAFRPCHEADPLFAQVLKAAQEAGVQLLAYDIVWHGGRALLGKQLPVVFGEGVNTRYDPARLQEVLEFNATDPRKNWKSGAGAKKAAAGAGEGAKKKTGRGARGGKGGRRGGPGSSDEKEEEEESARESSE